VAPESLPQQLQGQGHPAVALAVVAVGDVELLAVRGVVEQFAQDEPGHRQMLRGIALGRRRRVRSQISPGEAVP
jgi:hypothetical protein